MLLAVTLLIDYLCKCYMVLSHFPTIRKYEVFGWFKATGLFTIALLLSDFASIESNVIYY